MKKIFAIFALAAMLIVPMSALAITTVSDSDLAAVTGQSGVSIDLNVTVNMTADVIAWGDSDGINIIQGYQTSQGDETYNKAGYVGLQSLNITGLNIKMRDFSDVGSGQPQANDTEWNVLHNLLANYSAQATLAANGQANNATSAKVAMLVQAFKTNTQYNSALTIDVGSDASNKTIVSIGVPSFNISLATMTANVALFAQGATTTTNNPNKIPVQTINPQVLGTLNVNNLTALFWGGRVDISALASGTQGVDISLKNVLIERLAANGMSWGDADGVVGGLSTYNGTTYSSAGYIGITGQNLIQNLKMNGDLTIDVASIDVATLNNVWHSDADGTNYVSMALGTVTAVMSQQSEYEMIYAAKKILGSPAQNDSIAYVHLAFSNGFDINIEGMYMPIVLWNSPDLASSYGLQGAGATARNTHELGVIYAKNLDVKIVNGAGALGATAVPSYVNIMAH